MTTMPVDKGFYVTSPFGARWGTTHWGTDFGRNGGSGGHPIYAVKDGTVTAAGPASGFGQWINVDHPASNGGGLTVYGHIIPEVRVGQRVAEGQRIGYINPNSRTNGGVAPHLHFEWHRYIWSPPGGDRLDPMSKLHGAKWKGDAPPPPVLRPTPTDPIYFDVDWSQRFHFGRARNTLGIKGIAIHTTENGRNTRAEDVAQYQIDSESGSYHVLADSTGKRLRENTDDWQTWSTGNQGNDILLHLSFVARASWTRAQWLAEEKMLRAGATVCAYWCNKYGFPIEYDAKIGTLPGITTHDATRAWGGTDHTDPGPNFPWDVFIQYVKEAARAGSDPKEKDMATPAEIEAVVFKCLKTYVGPIGSDVKDVRQQLTGGRDAGEYPGFPQIDNRSIPDAIAAIGAHLELPGFFDPHGGSLKAKREEEGQK